MSDAEELKDEDKCEIKIIKKVKKNKKCTDKTDNQEFNDQKDASVQLEVPESDEKNMKANPANDDAIDKKSEYKKDTTVQLETKEPIELNWKNSVEANAHLKAEDEILNCNDIAQNLETKLTIEEYLEEQGKTCKTKRKKSKSIKINSIDEAKAVDKEEIKNEIIMKPDDTIIKHNILDGKINNDIVNNDLINADEKNMKNVFEKEIESEIQNKTFKLNINKEETDIKTVDNLYTNQIYDLVETKNKIERRLNSSNVDLDSFLDFDLEKYTTKPSYQNKEIKPELFEDSIDSMNAEELIKSIRKKYNISNESESEHISQSNSTKLKFAQDSDKFIEEILRSAETEKEKIKQRTTATEYPQTSKTVIKNEKQIAAKNNIEEMERYIKRLGSVNREFSPVTTPIRNDGIEMRDQPQQVFLNNYMRKNAGNARRRNSLSFNDRAFRQQQLEEKENILNEKLKLAKDLIKKQTEVVEHLGETSQKLSEFEATVKEARNVGQQRRMCFEQLEEGFDSICQHYQEELNTAQEFLAKQKEGTACKNKSLKSEMDGLLDEFVSSLLSRKSLQSRINPASRFQNEENNSLDSGLRSSRRSSLTNALNKHKPDFAYLTNGKLNKVDKNYEFNELSTIEKLKKEYEKILNDDTKIEETDNNDNQIKADDDDFITKIRKKYNLSKDNDYCTVKSKKFFDKDEKNDNDLNSSIIKFNEELTKAMSTKHNFPEVKPTSMTKFNYSKDNISDYSNKYSFNDMIVPLNNTLMEKKQNFDFTDTEYEDKKWPKSTDRYTFNDNVTFRKDNLNNFNSVNEISRNVDFQETLRNLKEFTNELQSADSKINRNDYNSKLSININATLQEKSELSNTD